MNDNLIITESQALKMIKSLVELSDTKSLPIEEGINIFFKIKNVNGIRPATHKYYEYNFKIIKNYLFSVGITKTDQVNNDVILNYKNYLFSTKAGNCYINKLVGALIHLITLLAKYGYIQKYDFNHIKLKEKNKEIKVLTLNQLKQLMDVVNKRSLLYQVAVQLFISTGVRRTELINIKISNINFKENSLFLERTKNHDPRNLFIDKPLQELLTKLIKTYDNIPENDFLFVNPKTKKPVTTSFVDSIFSKIKKDLDFNLSPHLLRHTFCTHMARANVDFKSLQKLMGHKTTAITLQYIELNSKDQLAKTSLQNNPLAILYKQE